MEKNTQAQMYLFIKSCFSKKLNSPLSVIWSWVQSRSNVLQIISKQKIILSKKNAQSAVFIIKEYLKYSIMSQALVPTLSTDNCSNKQREGQDKVCLQRNQIA